MGDDLSTISWNMGMQLMQPRGYGGVRIVESNHVPAGKAYVLPSGEMIVPKGMADKIDGISQRSDTLPLHTWEGSKPIVVNQTVEATTTDGGVLTIEKLEESRRRLMEITAPVDPAKEAMEADPMWGAF